MDLSEGALKVAISKSLENADDLIIDADILKDNNRIARAYCCYQLAMEEAGKAHLIFNAMFFDGLKTKAEINKFQKEFNNHVSKSQLIRLLMLIMSVDMKTTKPEIAKNIQEWTTKEILDPRVSSPFFSARVS